MSLYRDYPQKYWKKKNVNDLTAFHIAACAGNTEALQVFAAKNPSLLSIKSEGDKKWLPIHHAACWGHKEAVRYLMLKTDLQARDETPVSDSFDSELLLELLVDSNLHGLALVLLKKYPHLAEPDENIFWKETVTKLASKSRAYNSGRKLGFLGILIYSAIPVNDDDQAHVASRPPDNDIEMQNIILTEHSTEILNLPQVAGTIGALKQKLYTFLWNILIQLVPFIKRIHDQKHMHSQTLKLVKRMILKESWTYNKAVEYLKEPVLTAARLGIHEFVDAVLKAYPNSVLFKDEERRNIFLLPVLHRKEYVFSLIRDQVTSMNYHTNYIRDIHGHNILHLAGKMLVVPSQVPGAALQMQRELQWFMSISDLFPPLLQEQQNEDRLTPQELFTKEHENLMEKGESWMRDTAKSCLAEAAAIITIAFAAAFTVPGGSDPNEVQIYLNKTYFRIFALSVAVALFGSITSAQTFLGMLTSRYAEDDFLKALPKQLTIGLVTLFLSSTSMMVAFGAAFCILFSHQWKWAIILMGLLGYLPLTFFAWTQFPLLVDIFISTYGSGILTLQKHV